MLRFPLVGTRTGRLLSVALALMAPVGAAQAWDDATGSQINLASSTSPKQKLDFAKQAADEMDAAVIAVGKLKETAEKDGDPDKIQCVKNKEVAIKALVDVSRKSNAALKEALQAGQSDLAEHEFRKVAVARSKTSQFLAEARACVGGGGTVAGNTDVEVNGGGLLDDGELGNDALDGLDEVLPPVTPPFTTFE